jgi:hypothetical protein
VKRDAADHLHVEVPHAKRSLRGLADDGKCLGQEIIQGLPPGKTIAEFRGLGPERLIREGRDSGFQAVNFGDDGLNPLQVPLVLGTDNL